MTFGERLYECMQQAGYSQKQLAEKINITPTRLNYWIKDKRQPDIPWIRALADALNVSTDYLIGNTSESPSDADLLQKLVSSAGGNEFVLALARSWLKLDEAQREVLNRFIDDVVEDYRTSRAENALAATAEAVEAAASDDLSPAVGGE